MQEEIRRQINEMTEDGLRKGTQEKKGSRRKM
jgi:hypothetical protein